MLTLTQPKTTVTLSIEVETTHMGTQVMVDGNLAGTIEEYPVWGLDSSSTTEMIGCGLSMSSMAYAIAATGQVLPNLSAAVAVVIASHLTNPSPKTSDLPDYF